MSSVCIHQTPLRVVITPDGSTYAYGGLRMMSNAHSNRTNTLLTVNGSLTEKARFIFGRCLQAAYPARCGPHLLLQLAKGTAMIKHPSNELGRNP